MPAHIILKIYAKIYVKTYSPIVQWIEHEFSKLSITVRICVGLQIISFYRLALIMR